MVKIASHSNPTNKWMWCLFQELERRTRESEVSLQQLEQQASQETSRIQQLQAELLVCKEELEAYMEQLQDTKNIYDSKLAKKNEEVNVDNCIML